VFTGRIPSFYSGKNADQALGDAVPGSDGMGLLLFSDGTGEVEVGTASPLRHLPGVLLDTLRLLRDELLEALDQKPLLAHKSFHRLCPTDRQVAFEHSPVETRYRSGNLFCMLFRESFHGAPLFMVARRLP